jgi:hypothetical protein
MAGILGIIEGAAAIAAGVAIDVFVPGGAAIGNLLIGAGAGMVMTGVGTLISGNPVKGFATTLRNSIAPWRVCYGRCRTGGSLVYMHQWGENNQMLDLVIVLCAHAGQAVDELLFDQQRIQIDTTAIPTTARAGYSIPTPIAGAGTSFTPVQQKIVPTSITRTSGVVEVVLPQDIPYLDEGDQVILENVPGDPTLNGTFQVAQIISRVPSGGTKILTFTFLSGGLDATVLAAGHCLTKWADYGRNVYFEALLGGQVLGETFVGMTAGAPWQGTGKLCTPASPQNAGGIAAPNPWTQYCSLQGKTAVFLRLKYDQKYFPAGLPQISFHLRGKKDIYDPRTSPPSRGYSENAVLCIADFLADEQWGFRAQYGTEIPLGQLAADANTCDEAVALARGGTEPRYACNGQFELTTRRGEVLQNMLTSCAGRLTYVGGQFRIQPGTWEGPGSPAVQQDLTAIAMGPYKWRSAAPLRELYNGIKGTYISPANKWQSTDYPSYAQDAKHGYSGPSLYGGDILLAADRGERRWRELHLPFTISAATAQRIAKIELLRGRGGAGSMIGGTAQATYGGTGTFPVSLAGYQFTPLQVFQATVGFLGWTNKFVEVAALRFAVQEAGQGSAPMLGVELDVRETDSDIYAWSVEEELSPQAYVQTKLPAGTFAETAPLPWSPGYAAPLAGDAIGGPATFGVKPVYGTDAAGNGTASVQIIGTPPINQLDTGVAAPLIACTPATTGGAIAPGTYVVGLTAYDSGGATQADTDYQSLAVVEVGGSGAGSIAVAVTWGSGDDGGELYMGRWNASGFVMHRQATLAPGAASATLAAFDETTHGGPDPLFDHFGVAWQVVRHAGIFAAQVQAVTATTVTMASLAAGDVAIDEFAGRVLSLLAKLDATVEVPVLHMPVASNTASVGTPALFTVTIGANTLGATLPNLTTLLAVGDLLAMRPKCTFTADGFSDTGYANAFAPTGADPVVQPGRVAVMLNGPDAGDVQTILSVGLDGGGHYTDWKLAGTWTVTPNAGDLVVVCDASVRETPSDAFVARNGSAIARFTSTLANLARTVWLCRVRTEDVAGSSGPDLLAPMREIYLFGAAGPGITPPSGLTLTPALREYGTLTAENVAISTAPDGVEGIDFYLVEVDELTADVWVTCNASVSGVTDPVTIVVTPNPGRTTPTLTLDFAVGQWVLFNDPGNFEIGKLTAIHDNGDGTFNFTIARHYAGAPGGTSTFLAPLGAHAASTQILIAQQRRFLLNSQTGGFDGAAPPKRFDMPIASSCVLAIVAAPYNAGGYGPWVVYNLATATMPGIRTLIGLSVPMQKAGTLAAATGVNVLQALRLPFDAPQRVNSAYVDTAPTGASLKVNVRRSSDGGTTWSTVEQLVIPAGSLNNWASDPPQGRQAPYAGAWPFPVWKGGDLVDITVEQVGSTVAGANLTVLVDM